jgi:hypothetical protein
LCRITPPKALLSSPIYVVDDSFGQFDDARGISGDRCDSRLEHF